MLRLWAFLSITALCGQTSRREVAITIDDLPWAGARTCELTITEPLTRKLLQPFRDARIPVIGFVNEGRCTALGGDGLRRILNLWIDAGADLGNHTYSHPDLNRTPLVDYQSDIARGETITSGLLHARGQRLRYFRHPFLHAGTTIETKRGLEQYLAGRGYQVAPVTFDNSDWMFAFVYKDAFDRGDDALARRVRDAYVPYMESVVAFFEKRSVEVAGREFPQVLLIHANQLNAELLPSLLDMFRKRGYRFITLEQALADSVYQLRDDYAGPGGFSWIHRWSKTKGMEPKSEPDEPPFVSDAYPKLSSDR